MNEIVLGVDTGTAILVATIIGTALGAAVGAFFNVVGKRETKAQLNQVKSEIKAASTQDATNVKQEIGGQVSELKDDFKTLTKQIIEEQTKRIEAQSQRVDDLRDALNRTNVQLDEARADIRKLREENERQRDVIDQQADRLLKATLETNEQKLMIAKQQATIEIKDREIASLKQLGDQVDAQLKAQDTKIAKLEHELQQVRDSMIARERELQAEIDRLRSELAQEIEKRLTAERERDEWKKKATDKLRALTPDEESRLTTAEPQVPNSIPKKQTGSLTPETKMLGGEV